MQESSSVAGLVFNPDSLMFPSIHASEEFTRLKLERLALQERDQMFDLLQTRLSSLTLNIERQIFLQEKYLINPKWYVMFHKDTQIALKHEALCSLYYNCSSSIRSFLTNTVIYLSMIQMRILS